VAEHLVLMAFLSDATNAALGRLALAETTGADAVTRLRDIRSLQTLLDAEPAVLTAVREALAAGVSWEVIAEAAGVKPAAAKWRWQGTDQEITARLAAGRKRSARPSSVPTDLPGLSVAEAARTLGVSAQAVYLQISRGKLEAHTVTLEDGRSYKRVVMP
jgi:hypothetical protein